MPESIGMMLMIFVETHNSANGDRF